MSQVCNDLGICAELTRWTDTTKLCYSRGCVCEGCIYSEFFKDSKKCHAKAHVLELVRVKGTPNKVDIGKVILED